MPWKWQVMNVCVSYIEFDSVYDFSLDGNISIGCKIVCLYG